MSGKDILLAIIEENSTALIEAVDKSMDENLSMLIESEKDSIMKKLFIEGGDGEDDSDEDDDISDENFELEAELDDDFEFTEEDAKQVYDHLVSEGFSDDEIQEMVTYNPNMILEIFNSHADKLRKMTPDS